MKEGERQVAPHISQIRNDHVARYVWASRFVNLRNKVVDALCGVGYGSNFIATNTRASSILAFDGDFEAINYANKHYANPKIEFKVMHAYKTQLPYHEFDLGIMFEAIEHVDNPLGVLCELHSSIRPGGKFLVSVPHEEKMPFSKIKFPFHYRHYSKEDISTLLESTGFSVVNVYSQRRRTMKIEKNTDGEFLILECDSR